ncbi:hypothetical protein G6F31_020660 [Rhizopus arrhizus]|nr:hypothetical protein G6F31_020660 [Rhizopus arrhizus]
MSKTMTIPQMMSRVLPIARRGAGASADAQHDRRMEFEDIAGDVHAQDHRHTRRDNAGHEQFGSQLLEALHEAWSRRDADHRHEGGQSHGCQEPVHGFGHAAESRMHRTQVAEDQA